MPKPRTTPRRLTIAEVEREYDVINDVYFRGALPKWVKFGVRNIGEAYGETSKWTDENDTLLYYQIEFDKKLWEMGKRMVFIVLRHEMCHLHAGLEAQHGKRFHKSKLRLIKLGAYDDIL